MSGLKFNVGFPCEMALLIYTMLIMILLEGASKMKALVQVVPSIVTSWVMSVFALNDDRAFYLYVKSLKCVCKFRFASYCSRIID